jgi:hypothetical protein
MVSHIHNCISGTGKALFQDLGVGLYKASLPNGGGSIGLEWPEMTQKQSFRSCYRSPVLLLGNTKKGEITYPKSPTILLS